MCASPRSNFILRNIPPSQTTAFAANHDAGIWNCLQQLLDTLPDSASVERANIIAQLPQRLGGLGLRSATRTANAAFWASWADTLPMIHARHPLVADQMATELRNGPDSRANGPNEIYVLISSLRAEGYHNLPSWEDIIEGRRPSAPANITARDRCDWMH